MTKLKPAERLRLGLYCRLKLELNSKVGVSRLYEYQKHNRANN